MEEEVAADEVDEVVNKGLDKMARVIGPEPQTFTFNL